MPRHRSMSYTQELTRSLKLLGKKGTGFGSEFSVFEGRSIENFFDSIAFSMRRLNFEKLGVKPSKFLLIKHKVPELQLC